MNSLDEILKLIPYSLQHDPFVVAMFEATVIQLQEAYDEAHALSDFTLIDRLPEDMLDLIAYEKHVDFYDHELSIVQKRQLIKRSVSWHRKKGTRAAIEDVVSIVYPNAQVFEWFEYDGAPYFFIIEIDQPFVYEKDMSRLKRMVMATKNLRSWLEYIIVRFGKMELNLAHMQWHYPVLYPIAGYHWTEGIKGAALETAFAMDSAPFNYPVLYPIAKEHYSDGIKGKIAIDKTATLTHQVAAITNPYPVCGDFYGGGY